MIKLSQRDPRWSWKKIGNSNSTIGAYGCTITCIAMASDYFRCYHDPGWMAKYLKFLNDLVIWQSIEKVCCFKFKWRYYKHDKPVFAEALINPKTVLLLNVQSGRHWVIATKKVWGGYWVVDPWTGRSTYYLDNSVVGGTVLTIK